MKARDAIGLSAYGPERLKQIYRAFDQAWEAIKPLIDNTPLAQEAARLTLANTILSLAKSDLEIRSAAEPTIPVQLYPPPGGQSSGSRPALFSAPGPQCSKESD